MPYIGTQPLTGQFKKLDAITVVNGQAAYTLNHNSAAYKPATANALLVSVNGVIQAAGDAFTISGSTITFTENLVTGDVIDFIIALGDTGSAVTPVDGSVTTAKIADDAVTSDKLASGVAQAPISVAVIADVKDNSTGGGTSVSWGSGGNNRDLNTKLFDPDNIVTISSNQFILGAGTYIIEFSAPSYFGDRHIAQLYDVTNSASVQYGSMEYSHGTNGGYGSSFGYARVVITSNTTYKIVHYIESGKSSNGLGVNSSLAGTESVYTQVKITKMG